MNKKTLKPYFDKGIDYQTYLEEEKTLLNSTAEVDYREYHSINLKRMERNSKIAKKQELLSDSVRSRIEGKRLLAISEGWCGDAAQIIPFAAAIAEEAHLDFKIVYRDQNHDLMNDYLTNGGMAIPVIIAVDEEYVPLDHFAPRPAEAQELMQEMKAKGEKKEDINIALQKWYNKDKGQRIVKEITDMLAESP